MAGTYVVQAQWSLDAALAGGGGCAPSTTPVP
jgi:hypothetical protein